MRELIERLKTKEITDEELLFLLETDIAEALYAEARLIAQNVFGFGVFVRGLIEFSNFCSQNCYYCGIRKENKAAKRYRLSKSEILDACAVGAELGIKTFVLQSGEDAFYKADVLADIIREIRRAYPDSAITLSVGERTKKDYEIFREAGADRYLLRHEAINPELFKKLHPDSQKLTPRLNCLKNLKDAGFQVGTGFMTGAPYQTKEHIIQDIRFLVDFKPEMIGIGTYLTGKNTPFANMQNGDIETALRVIAILRIMAPKTNIPATTALATIHERGRELAILAGANVVMPNISPMEHRSDYMLYDNKICLDEKTALDNLKKRLDSIGYKLDFARGDYL